MPNVTSNNGTVHRATVRTTLTALLKDKAGKILGFKNQPKEHAGYVRKACDGQWVPISRATKAAVTCAACNRG